MRAHVFVFVFVCFCVFVRVYFARARVCVCASACACVFVCVYECFVCFSHIVVVSPLVYHHTLDGAHGVFCVAEGVDGACSTRDG